MDSSAQPLTEHHDVALLDLDGVVYLGEEPIAGAPQALAAARERGLRLAFVTNNASRTPAQVADLLSRMGVPARPEEVITSAQAAAHDLADRLPAGARVLVLGTDALRSAVAERGLVPVASADDGPAAVVQGFSRQLGWPELAEGAVAIRQGAFWLATNLDATVPSPRGRLPGNGALIAALSHAVGFTPPATGKPDPTMHRESVERAGARRPIVVGDRLDTDIEGARRVGCPSLLVLTGVSTPAELLAAPPEQRPDYLGADLTALTSPHPQTRVDSDVVRCNAATVRRVGSRLELSGGSNRLDALRALAVAAWQGDPKVRINGVDEDSRRVLDELGLADSSA